MSDPPVSTPVSTPVSPSIKSTASDFGSAVGGFAVTRANAIGEGAFKQTGHDEWKFVSFATLSVVVAISWFLLTYAIFAKNDVKNDCTCSKDNYEHRLETMITTAAILGTLSSLWWLFSLWGLFKFAKKTK